MRKFWAGAMVASVLLSIVALPAKAARGDTPMPNAWIALYGTPGDPITPVSGSRLFTQTSTTHITAGASATGLGLSINGDVYYTFEFAQPAGQNLAVGSYANADRLVSRRPGHPGMDISGSAVGCNVVSGDFTINDISFVNGTLDRLDMTFIQHCEGGTGAIFGEASYNEPVAGPLLLQLIGTTSASRTITVTNTGDQSQTIAPTMTGDDAADFPLTSTCDAHLPVAAGATCTLTVAFSPVAVEDRRAWLMIADGTRRGSHTIGLEGSGASVPWLTYPYDGQNDVYTSHVFTWLTLPNAQANILIVGTHEGGTDLVNTGVLPGSQTSFQVPALPSNVGLYAYVFSEINGHWQHSPPVTFDLTPQVAKFTTPTDGWAGLAPIQVFTWFNNVEADGYDVIVGTAPGSQNLANSGVLPSTAFSYDPPPLPTDVRLYATVFTEWAGHWDFSNSISFTYKSGAEITSPINGQVAVTTSTSYGWAPFATAQAYWLVVGTTPGSANVIDAGPMPPVQTTYPGVALPAGKTLYATLFTEIAGSWAHSDTIIFYAASG